MEKIFVLKSIIYDSRFDSSVFYESNPLYFRVTDRNYRKMSRYEKPLHCPCCAYSPCDLIRFIEQLCKKNMCARNYSLFKDYKLYTCAEPQKCGSFKKQTCNCKSRRRNNKFFDNKNI